MKKYLLVSCSLLFFSSYLFANCDIQFTVNIDYKKQDYTFLELDDTSVLYQTSLPDSQKLTEYQKYIHSKTNVDPIYLLNHQREIYARYLPQYVPRYDQIINKQIGTISSQNCLTATLFAKHLEKQADYYTEFGAYILKSNGKMRIYFQSSDTPSIPSNLFMDKKIYNDLSNGWSLESHIHSHPFAFDNPTGDIAGTLIPSGNYNSADLGTYITAVHNYNMQSAVITNGFDMITFQQSEFDNIDPAG